MSNLNQHSEYYFERIGATPYTYRDVIRIDMGNNSYYINDYTICWSCYNSRSNSKKYNTFNYKFSRITKDTPLQEGELFSERPKISDEIIGRVTAEALKLFDD